jgi:hypothetical protein
MDPEGSGQGRDVTGYAFCQYVSPEVGHGKGPYT